MWRKEAEVIGLVEFSDYYCLKLKEEAGFIIERTYLNGTEIKEGETSPPKRYNSGSIILAMENAGKLIEEEELRESILAQINDGYLDIGSTAGFGEELEYIRDLINEYDKLKKDLEPSIEKVRSKLQEQEKKVKPELLQKYRNLKK